MPEYIDREAFKQKLIENGFFPAIVQKALEEMPREDVVAVVRCKDCIYRLPLESVDEYKGKKAMHCFCHSRLTRETD